MEDLLNRCAVIVFFLNNKVCAKANADVVLYVGSPQVTVVINAAISCHYLLPDTWLLLKPRRVTSVLLCLMQGHCECM